MDEAAERTKVEWREWGREAFEEAAEEDRPVLLAVTGFWCGWCRAMDGRTYDDPRIAANVNDATVPVRVDADEHPLVRARYTMGGLPATVFTTPGGELLASAGYLDPEEFMDVFDRVQETWAEGGPEVGQVPEPLRDASLPGGRVTDEIERHLVGQLDAQYDSDHGGWGTDAKFPLPSAIEFALSRRPEQATRSLQAIYDALEDPVDAGFFRFARSRDWSEPMLEKLLSVNASILRASANAYLSTGDETFRAACERTVEFLGDTLWTDEGFANSQAPGEYFSLPPGERHPTDAPPVDSQVYTDSTARAIDGLLTVVAYTDHAVARDLAEQGMNFIRDSRLQAGGFHHSSDAASGPFLTDQAAGLQALTTASQVLGDEYLDPARAVADRAIADLQSESGAFVDAVPAGPALLDRPLHPIDDNARMADALIDLSYLTGEDGYREAARDAVAAFGDAAEHLGVQAATYGRAASRLVDPPLVIDVATDPGTDLHRAALRMADHEKVVVPNASVDGPGDAAIRGADQGRSPITTPQELADTVREVFDHR